MTYNVFKFVHIVAVMVWLGGLVAVSVLSARIARTAESAVVAAISQQNRFFGTVMVGPAAGVTLVAGIVMMAVSHVGFTFWIEWGLGAMIVSSLIGATVLRRAGIELSTLLASARRDDARVVALERRLAQVGAINLLVLLSAVWMMVTKPG